MDQYSDVVWEGNMALANKSVIATLDRSVKRFTFVYAAIKDTSKWRGTPWRMVKKEFDTIDAATEAAGLWMRVCFEHDCPVAVAVQEVK